jgi:ABC-2 type transport system permease protein
MLLLLAMVVGFAVGLGLGGAYRDYSWHLVFPLLIVFYALCSFLGDALLPVTAVDAEGDAIALLRRSSISPVRIFAAKATLQVAALAVFCCALLVALHAILRLPPLLFLAGLVIGLSSAIACGTIQVGSSAIFPRFNWEHHREIGNSPRASTLCNIASGTYLVLSLEIAAVCGALRYLDYMGEGAMLLATGTGSLGSALVAVCTMVFMVHRRRDKHWEDSCS